jgi:hypothetical protein
MEVEQNNHAKAEVVKEVIQSLKKREEKLD